MKRRLGGVAIPGRDKGDLDGEMRMIREVGGDRITKQSANDLTGLGFHCSG